ncbi:hypothetical protein C8A05DRAFT_45190 [Staphylotrichum tortipilum]|uniref:F-box domain-containing protein n=1 Tax=Staphylotrichum tortipilum TaxID=2831512 RepID=A0AAN6RS88_9PEZI|nr:hypothetical protein C8A05DRAFT_45190 [Staphylotrichum longicolle]
MDIVYHCTACGFSISQDTTTVSWTRQFRGVVRSLQDPAVYVTGVGRYSARHSGVFFAPPNSHARWDDAGYVRLWAHQFALPDQPETVGKRGFNARYPAPVAIARLFDVLASVPWVAALRLLDWGHDYGGFAVRRGDGKAYFPWEGCLAGRQYPVGLVPPRYDLSPLASAELSEILAEAPQSPPSRHGFLSRPAPGAPSPARDPFGALPTELCSAIAACLPTADLLNARLASRSFCGIYDSQHFWASRFSGPASERGWLFEAAQDLQARGGTRRRDWRWLYRRTADNSLGPALQNRRRVWSLVLNLLEPLELAWNELPSNLPPPWDRPFPSVGTSPGSAWTLASGNLEGYDYDLSPLKEGRVNRVRVQQVPIPVGGISRIAIAGLTLTAAGTGHVLRLGYSWVQGGTEQTVQLDGLSVRGFNLAVGVGGIQAIQCITGSGAATVLSAWLGCPDESPKTARLSRVVADGQQQTLPMEFGFDGIRLVSLAVVREPSAQNTQHHPSDPEGSEDADGKEVPKGSEDPEGNNDDNAAAKLRNSALWYPEMPPSDVDLNVSFLHEPDTYGEGYRPMFWTRFGGRGGCHLSALVKIDIRPASGRMDFFFNRPEVPNEYRSFGRQGYYMLEEDDPEEDLDDAPIEFPIDGPSGEFLTKLETLSEFNQEYSLVYALVWLKLHTNRGRTCEVGSYTTRRPEFEYVERDFVVAPGTAITGFYGATDRDVDLHLMLIGVMTEPTGSWDCEW